MNTSRAQWLEARRQGLGGSDAAAVLGLSRWKTPLTLYQEKRGEADDGNPDTPSMFWGRTLEPTIRQHYAEQTQRVVRLPDGILTHPKYPFMLATLDGLTDDGRVVEVKTARSANGWGEPGSNQLPTPYLLQVQHYMAVTGCAVADVAVLISGSDFRLYEIPADEELQEMLIARESKFWEHVVNGIPPEPVSCADMLAKFGGSSNGFAIEATPEVRNALETLENLKAQIKAMAAKEEEAKTIVMKAMGEAESLTWEGETVATWKQAKAPSKFDLSAFKDKHPDLYQQFSKEGTASRRFLIKA